jgi:N-carbamoylputrescine amidase
MTNPRVALAQLPGSLDAGRNRTAAEQLVRQAAAAGANLICLPELANTIYMPFENDERYFAQAEPLDGEQVRHMEAVARDTGTMVVYPFFEVDEGRYYNSTVVIGTDGEHVGHYRKASLPTSGLYPDGSETFYFTPGDRPLQVIETPWGFSFGVVICYERNLPEPARCLGLMGADLRLVPVATVDVVRPWWELLLRAHAVFNIFYVGACNKVGPEEGGDPDQPYFGTSLGVDPTGEVIATGSCVDPEVVLFDVDPAVLARQRERWSFYADRRPDLYQALTAQPRP